MSMLDSFFNKGFKAAKCKTLLKLTIPRIKLLRNRREIQIKQMRRDIAKLLETGQEATARIRVEHIIREENMMAAQEVLELYSELIAVRLPIIETQRECPLDLKEAISSLCFAAPRCADLPELLQVQMLFASKYGKEFISAATELMPDCGVNRQLIELLSVRAPPPEKKLKLLKEIAEEHELDWDPAASETELLKSHEDLLNGPTQFFSGSKLPLPEPKLEEISHIGPDQVHNEQPDYDSGFDTLDFPEVPKAPLRPIVNVASAPEIVSPPAIPHPGIVLESLEHPRHTANLSEEPHVKPHQLMQERSMANNDGTANVSVGGMEDKQFLPFVSPPSPSTSFSATQSSLPPAATSFPRKSSPPPVSSFSMRQSSLPQSLSRTRSDINADFQDVLAAAQAAADTAERAAKSSPPPVSSFSMRQSTLPQSRSRTRSDANVDFQDVLAAAQAAADTAERAAAAARSAASLAQIRIAELTKNKNDEAPEDSCENPFSTDIPNESATTEELHVSNQNLDDSYDILHSPNYDYHLESEVKAGLDASPPKDPGLEHKPANRQPQRLPSMDDDPYFSYPNLFTSQNSNLSSGAQSFTENFRSTNER